MADYLVDENLPLLPFWINKRFVHASSLDLYSNSDIWQYALLNKLIIVTKDSDFYYKFLSSKASPKVIWIRTGNLKRVDLNSFIERIWTDVEEMLAFRSFILIDLEKLKDCDMKIFLIGFMGCGKTYLGKLLSEKLTMPFFDLDEKIAEHEGKSISDVFANEGEEYFRLLEKDVLHLITESHETFIMATGGGTPCFYNNIDYLKKQGIVVWINCSTECLYQRLLKGKEKRPLLSKIPDEELKNYIIKKYSSRKIYYQQATVILPEENTGIDVIVNKIFHAKS